MSVMNVQVMQVFERYSITIDLSTTTLVNKFEKGMLAGSSMPTFSTAQLPVYLFVMAFKSSGVDLRKLAKCNFLHFGVKFLFFYFPENAYHRITFPYCYHYVRVKLCWNSCLGLPHNFSCRPVKHVRRCSMSCLISVFHCQKEILSVTS